MRMKAIDQNSVDIIGAAFLRASVQDKKGNIIETPQLVYITNSTEKSFEACIALGLIPKNFPSPLEAADAISSLETTHCRCPKRELPPPLPHKTPFPATEENVPKLKD